MKTYDPGDYNELASWFTARDIKPPALYELPQYGLFYPDTGAMFLIQTDTPTCIIDFLITNPKAPSDARRNAIYRMTTKLTQTAKNLGYSRILCRSQIDTIKDWAISLNFRDLGEFWTFCKEI